MRKPADWPGLICLHDDYNKIITSGAELATRSQVNPVLLVKRKLLLVFFFFFFFFKKKLIFSGFGSDGNSIHVSSSDRRGCKECSSSFLVVEKV